MMSRDHIVGFIYGMLFMYDTGLMYLLSRRVDYTDAKNIVIMGVNATISLMVLFTFANSIKMVL